MKNDVKITQSEFPEEEVPKEVMAQSLVKIGKACAMLLSTGLQRKDFVAMIHQRAKKVPPRTIGVVLDALEQLKKEYGK